MNDHIKLLALEVPVLDPAREFDAFCKQARAQTPERLVELMKPKKPHLREMTEDDIPHLIDVDKEAFPDDPYDADTFKKHLGQGGGYAIEDDGRPVAYALHRPVESRPGFHYVQSIATHKDHRRKGYASQLLDKVKSLGKGVTLDVDVKNKGARALYRKHGFQYEDTLDAPDGSGRVAQHLALKMAFDLDAEEEARQKLPYRDRAEMYAMKDGKVFGSVYPDSKAFGVYGGGIDPGENPLEAAAREFQEESGWTVKNPRMLPFNPHLNEWKPPYSSEKHKERAKQFRGSRTHYITGDLGEQVPGATLDELGRKDARLYAFDEALKLSAGTDPELAHVNTQRAKVLQHLKEQHRKSLLIQPHDVDKRLSEIGFPFDWKERAVWGLNLPAEKMPVSDLTWHMDEPFWDVGDDHHVRPKDVVANPGYFPTHDARVDQADISHPLDVMEHKGRWQLLDGLHRLVKLQGQGATEATVRKVPASMIPKLNGGPTVLEQLQEAKAHSDRGDYSRKNAILRNLIRDSPKDWQIDSPAGKYQGITHTPTQFKLHAPRDVTSLLKSGFDTYYTPWMVLVKRAKDSDTPFTIAIDLDGTLAEKEQPFSAKSIGTPRKRAVFWARLFHEAGARIIIFTVRGDDKLVGKWLKEHDVPFDYINENPDQPEDSSGKIIADCYWDDKAYNAEDPDEFGPEILRRLLSDGKKAEPEAKDDGPSVTITISNTTCIMAAPELLDALEADAH